MGNFLNEQVEVPRRTMVLFFIVDTSGSMEGTKIGAVNNAIEEVLPEIEKISSSNPDAKIKIAVLDFSTDAVWLTPAPVDAGTYAYNYLNAGGLTSLGDACLALNEKLSRNEFMQEAVGSYAPALFLMSDGAPTDDWEKGLEVLKKNKWYKKSIKVAVAIGDDADTQVLQEFTGNKETVLTVHTPAALKSMIKFIAITSSEIGSKSSSVPLRTGAGDDANADPQDFVQSKQDDFNDALAAMAPAILASDADDDDDVWG